MKSHFIYSGKYDFKFWGLNKLHPFDGEKFSKAWKVFSSKYNQQISSIYTEPLIPISDTDLLQVHTQNYLSSINYSKNIARVIEIQPASFIPNSILQKKLIKPVKLACSATLLATELALKEKIIAMNFGGGYHHAFADHGEGFCFFADAFLSIVDCRKKGLLNKDDKILMIDLDAHRGNGFDALTRNDPAIKNFDMYNFQIYPGLHDGEVDDYPYMIPLKSGIRDAAYLSILETGLIQFLEQYKDAKLIFYNAGNDVLETDTLGHMNISYEGVIKRDKFVIKELSKRSLPTVVMTSGGYSKQSYKLIAALAETVLSCRVNS